MKKVWIVEDEEDIADLVAHNIRKEQLKTRVFYDGESFLKTLDEEIPDLVVLDLMLPGIQGLDVCRTLRADERTKGIAITILTARDSEMDVVLGLELGADDYIVKPFSVRELMARIKAILRRTESTQNVGAAAIEGLTINSDNFNVKIDNEPVALTYAEFKILSLLISKTGRVFTREQIIQGIWDDHRIVTSKTVDVHITRLRRKLGKYESHIKTVRGVGYKFSR